MVQLSNLFTTFVWLAMLWSRAYAHIASIASKTIAPGVEMPIVMVGTWTSGTSEDVKAIVRTWLGQGGIGIDEALVYQNQGMVAQAIKEAGVARNQLFIESKIPGCGGDEIARSWVEQILRELDTTYLDLLLIHAPRGPDCLGTWRVLEEYHSQGILKAIGVSNFQVPHLQALLAHAKVKPAVNQIQFNVFFHDDELVAFCRQNNITPQSWGPLGGAHNWFKRSVFTEPTINTIAQAHQVSAAQVALRWVIQHGLTIVFLSGDARHQQNDADIFGFSLTDKEMEMLDALPHTGGSPVQKSDALLPQFANSNTQVWFGTQSFVWSNGLKVLVVGLASIFVLAAPCSLLRGQAPQVVSRTPSRCEDLELSESTVPDVPAE